jgi:hypothetical protein
MADLSQEVTGNRIALARSQLNHRGNMDGYFNTRQAAQEYGLSVSYLNKLRVFGGGCQYAKVGRRVLYRKADFDLWMASRVRANTSDFPGGAVAVRVKK